MCVTVSVKRGGEYTDCDTVADLAKALGIDPSAVSSDPPECCLCNAMFNELTAVKQTDPNKWWPEYVIDLGGP